MAAQNSSENDKNTYALPLVILGFIILGSIAYFGNFWYRALTGTANNTQETANSPEAQVAGSTTTQETPAASKIPQIVQVAAENKSDKPVIELFVMSHCPYGTQMEKAILPAIEALGDTVDFQLKFVYYAMHGEMEMQEQLAQYCIQKEDPQKLIPYLNCFLQEGDSSACLSKAQISPDTLKACTAQADTEFGITAAFEDKNSWLSGRFPMFNIHAKENENYGVRGSPTLVINGQTAQVSSRDPNTVLGVICSYFNDAPNECSETLSTDVPSPGFGSGTGSGSSGSCN